MSMLLFGGIKAGGSKFTCAIGNASGNIQNESTIAITTPEETIHKIIQYFLEMHSKQSLSAIGIATFGPLDLDGSSPHYGYHYGHVATPIKTGWGHINFLGIMREAFNMPFGWDTDVNGAALGEYRFGIAKNLDTFIYVTVGTGIGAGGMIDGKLMHGLTHPEMGHIFIPHDHKKDKFAGVCMFHGDCLEGLASGPALQKRWGVKKASDLPTKHVGWDLEADYLATALASYTLILSPQKIIVGGGVMCNKELLPKIRPKVKSILNGYIKHKKILEQIDDYIVEPGLGEQSGIYGAIALAEDAYLETKKNTNKG